MFLKSRCKTYTEQLSDKENCHVYRLHNENQLKHEFFNSITLSKFQGYILLFSEVYLEPIQTSTMEFFNKIDNG